ncbi:MAG: hypothetical protein IH595_11145 [Bacteroidales bacterium]|nr:hypothetical protein [Bacteroidales bacterium]
MQPNLIKKPCPVCKTKLRASYSNRWDEIIRCPNCGALLIDNPKRKSTGMFISIGGLVLWSIISFWIGTSVLLLTSIVAVSFLISLLIRNFAAVRKELVIRNIETQALSYINKSEWDEIVQNREGRENVFEIIEEL